MTLNYNNRIITIMTLPAVTPLSLSPFPPAQPCAWLTGCQAPDSFMSPRCPCACAWPWGSPFPRPRRPGVDPGRAGSGNRAGDPLGRFRRRRSRRSWGCRRASGPCRDGRRKAAAAAGVGSRTGWCARVEEKWARIWCWYSGWCWWRDLSPEVSDRHLWT